MRDGARVKMYLCLCGAGTLQPHGRRRRGRCSTSPAYTRWTCPAAFTIACIRDAGYNIFKKEYAVNRSKNNVFRCHQVVTHDRRYVYILQYHIVWCAKYRKQAFSGETPGRDLFFTGTQGKLWIIY